MKETDCADRIVTMNKVEQKKQNRMIVLELNRPERMNALNREMLEDLDVTLRSMEQNTQIRCLIVTGSGEKAFAAGADLKEMENMTVEEAKEFARVGCAVFERLAGLHVPVIAAINGLAFGGGMELALACDFRIAADSAVMGLPEVTLGIMPGWNGIKRLVNAVGYAAASELIFTGKRISAREAKEIGLVNAVYSKETMLKETIRIGEMISKNAPIGIRNAKKAMRKEADYLECIALFAELFSTKDSQIGIGNFNRKQKTEQFYGR